MKKIFILFLIIFVNGCGQKGNIIKISCDEKDKLIVEQNAILVDVRSKSEYDELHLEGAINQSVYLIEDLNVSKDVPIIVYCKSGVRSNKAAMGLLKLGYKKIYDLGSMSKCS